MEYKSVAILGAGAVGSYLLWGLTNKNADVCIVADGDRAKRYESEGFIINDKLYKPVIKTPQEAHGTDLVIVCVKYNALNSAIEDLKSIADEHTTVLSLINGIDSEEIIGDAIGHEKIVHSLIKIASERNGNSVRFNPETTIGIVYGEKNPQRSSDRTDALARLFSDSGLKYRCSEHIVEEIWGKFLLNVPQNQIQAVLGVGVGAYTDSTHVAFLKQKMREEVLNVAAKKGIDIGLIDASSHGGSTVAKRARYSTLQDLDAHRHTEVDMFAGAMIKMGRELGVPTPYNEFVYHAIKALEEKNDGLFNYD